MVWQADFLMASKIAACSPWPISSLTRRGNIQPRSQKCREKISWIIKTTTAEKVPTLPNQKYYFVQCFWLARVFFVTVRPVVNINNAHCRCLFNESFFVFLMGAFYFCSCFCDCLCFIKTCSKVITIIIADKQQQSQNITTWEKVDSVILFWYLKPSPSS